KKPGARPPCGQVFLLKSRSPCQAPRGPGVIPGAGSSPPTRPADHRRFRSRGRPRCPQPTPPPDRGKPMPLEAFSQLKAALDILKGNFQELHDPDKTIEANEAIAATSRRAMQEIEESLAAERGMRTSDNAWSRRDALVEANPLWQQQA